MRSLLRDERAPRRADTERGPANYGTGSRRQSAVLGMLTASRDDDLPATPVPLIVTTAGGARGVRRRRHRDDEPAPSSPSTPGRRRASSTCRARRGRPGPAGRAGRQDRLQHLLAPPTGRARRPCSCAVPPPCRDDRDRRPRPGRDHPRRRRTRPPGMHPPAARGGTPAPRTVRDHGPRCWRCGPRRARCRTCRGHCTAPAARSVTGRAAAAPPTVPPGVLLLGLLDRVGLVGTVHLHRQPDHVPAGQPLLKAAGSRRRSGG